jgi:serine-type D-Ala-D-Ala endopeptidase (penicillin-binding protein 7)
MMALSFAIPAAASAGTTNVPILKPSASDPQIDASAYASVLVIDAASGKTLYKSEPAKPWVPASLTKLMTSYLFASKPRNWTAKGNILKADEVGGGRLAVSSGATMTLRDLLNAALVGSANNAATALARLSGMGTAGFVTGMNAELARMGLTNTVLRDASGMNEKNVTTAYDMMAIFQKARENPEIRKAMTTGNYQFTIASPKKVSKNVKNTNLLVFGNPDVIVTGGKTGYLEESKYNFALSASPGQGMPQNAGEVAVIVFGANTRDGSQQAAATLAKWAWNSFDWYASSSVPIVFPRTLALGDKGADVKKLQQWLNAHGFIIAKTGAGSPGKETELFGALTQTAIKKLQEAHAADILAPQGRLTATGAFDMLTRAFLNEHP